MKNVINPNKSGKWKKIEADITAIYTEKEEKNWNILGARDEALSTFNKACEEYKKNPSQDIKKTVVFNEKSRSYFTVWIVKGIPVAMMRFYGEVGLSGMSMISAPYLTSEQISLMYHISFSSSAFKPSGEYTNKLLDEFLKICIKHKDVESYSKTVNLDEDKGEYAVLKKYKDLVYYYGCIEGEGCMFGRDALFTSLDIDALFPPLDMKDKAKRDEAEAEAQKIYFAVLRLIFGNYPPGRLLIKAPEIKSSKTR